MRTCQSLAIILLALLSRVSGENQRLQPVRVLATIPTEILQQNEARSANETIESDEGPTKDVEVTGFITKDGDIFELSESKGLGSIEAREEPELEPGMTMCRYGTIVVYSDADCNTFFQPSANLGLPMVDKEDQSVEEETEPKPPRKIKKKTKGNRRQPSRNKVRKQKKKNKKNPKRKSQVRRGNKNRRRNNLKQKPKRKKNQKQRNQRRGNKKNVKRKRINSSEDEARSNSEPIQFAVLYDRH